MIGFVLRSLFFCRDYYASGVNCQRVCLFSSVSDQINWNLLTVFSNLTRYPDFNANGAVLLGLCVKLYRDSTSDRVRVEAFAMLELHVDVCWFAALTIVCLLMVIRRKRMQAESALVNLHGFLFMLFVIAGLFGDQAVLWSTVYVFIVVPPRSWVRLCVWVDCWWAIGMAMLASVALSFTLFVVLLLPCAWVKGMLDRLRQGYICQDRPWKPANS